MKALAAKVGRGAPRPHLDTVEPLGAFIVADVVH